MRNDLFEEAVLANRGNRSLADELNHLPAGAVIRFTRSGQRSDDRAMKLSNSCHLPIYMEEHGFYTIEELIGLELLPGEAEARGEWTSHIGDKYSTAGLIDDLFDYYDGYEVLLTSNESPRWIPGKGCVESEEKE